MADYSKMYHRLFNAISDALKCLDNNDAASATALLKSVQRETEQMYMKSPAPVFELNQTNSQKYSKIR